MVAGIKDLTVSLLLLHTVTKSQGVVTMRRRRLQQQHTHSQQQQQQEPLPAIWTKRYDPLLGEMDGMHAAGDLQHVKQQLKRLGACLQC
jgi:hypothetical protein